jgi:hypothetical protein
MKRLFIALTATDLATIVVPVSVHASALALDAAGNLFMGDGHSVSKYAPDGKKSTFAKGIDAAVMAVDCADVEEAVRENLDEAFGAHFLVTLKGRRAGQLEDRQNASDVAERSQKER